MTTKPRQQANKQPVKSLRVSPRKKVPAPEPPRVSPRERLLTVAEVAQLLGCHFRTVHRLIHTKLLRAVKVGRGFRITRQDYATYLYEQGTRPPGSAG
jgi:excisionase family DNA binding protein